MTKIMLRFKGGEGSGNFGHEGRPGHVGGSAPSDGDPNGGREKYAAAVKPTSDMKLMQRFSNFDARDFTAHKSRAKWREWNNSSFDREIKLQNGNTLEISLSPDSGVLDKNDRRSNNTFHATVRKPDGKRVKQHGARLSNMTPLTQFLDDVDNWEANPRHAWSDIMRYFG